MRRELILVSEGGAKELRKRAFRVLDFEITYGSEFGMCSLHNLNFPKGAFRKHMILGVLMATRCGTYSVARNCMSIPDTCEAMGRKELSENDCLKKINRRNKCAGASALVATLCMQDNIPGLIETP